MRRGSTCSRRTDRRVTDNNGAFEVPRLAAADYTIYASGAGGYLGMEYGASAPGRSGTFLVVADQAQLGDHDQGLARGVDRGPGAR